MENLGTVADITGGQVEIVNPRDLASKVNNVFASKTIALHAECTVHVGWGFSIQDTAAGTNTAADGLHLPLQQSLKSHCSIRKIGLISHDCDLTFSLSSSPANDQRLQRKNLLFEQEHKSNSSVNNLKGFNGLNPTVVPVQIQLRYHLPSGEVVLDTFTKICKVNDDRTDIESSINSTVVGLSAIHHSARLAHDGNYEQARINLISVQRLLQRTMSSTSSTSSMNETHQVAYLAFISQAEKLDQFMREAQAQDTLLKRENCNAEGNFDGKQRRQQRDDAASKAMFQMKNISVSNFKL